MAFHGTATRCLAHLLSSSFDSDVRISLAAFTGVSNASVQRWKSKGPALQGKTLVKACHFLDQLGYQVAELDTLDPSILKISRVFAFGLTTISRLAHELGYTIRPRSVLDVLVGRQGTSPERLKKAAAYADSLSQELSSAQGRLQDTLAPFRESLRVSTEKAAKHAASPAARGLPVHQGAQSPDDKAFILQAAANFVLGLIPIADFLLSESCSEYDRKKLHELAGPDSVLKLTTRLRGLCSETARRQSR